MTDPRRALPVALVLSGLLALPAPPALATAPVVAQAMPSDWQPTLGASDTVGVSGPPGVPLGTGSLRVPPGFYDHTFLAPASSLDQWSASVRIPAEASLDLVIWTDTTPDTPPTPDVSQSDDTLRASIPSAGDQWTGFDLSAEPWVLTHDHDASIPPETLSWDGYRAAHPDAVVTQVKMSFMAPPTASTGPSFHYLDAMTFGSSESATTYDFEPAPAWSLQTSLDRPVVPFGSTTAVSGQLTDPEGGPAAFQHVALFQKSYGADAYTVVEGTETLTSPSGGVATSVAPVSRTEYQWRPTDHFDRNVVPTTSVAEVRRGVTVNVSNRTARAGTAMVVFGLTRSPAVGKTVTVRRTGSTRVLGTATVRPDGTYALSRTMPRGSYSVFVTVPASNGLLSGQSRKVGITVR